MVVEGWEETTLGDICLIKIGGTPSRAVAEYWEKGPSAGYPWASISDLLHDPVIKTKEKITEAGVQRSNVKLIPTGTNLMSFKLTMGRVAKAGCDLYTNEAIAAFLPKSKKIDENFLYYILPQAAESADYDQAVKGKTLNKEKLNSLKVLLPPVSEQKKIVQIMRSADNALAKIEAVIAQTERVKKGLLQKLLTCGIDHKKFPQTEQDDIPEDWELKQLKDVCIKITDGSHQVVKTVEAGIPFLFVSCIRNERILWENCGCITKGVYDEISKGRETIKGSVLYTAVGSYGHAALIEEDMACSFQRHIAYLLPEPTKILPEYLTIYLNSPLGKKQADDNAIGNAQKTITLKSLRSFFIAVPPMAEQKEICKKIGMIKRSLEFLNDERSRLVKLKKGLLSDLLSGRVRVSASSQKQSEAA